MREFNLDEMRKSIAASVTPKWSSASDLSDQSLNAFFEKDSPVRRAKSRGILRLAGAGAEANRASAKSYASAIANFQRLINAVSGSFDDHRSIRGKLPDAIVRRSRLDVLASPVRGSVVVEFEPHVRPEEEISSNLEVRLLEQPSRQEVDRAVSAALDLLDSVHEGPEDSGSGFGDRIESLGPRVATTLRDFALSLEEGQFAPEIRWIEPQQSSRVTKLTAAELAYIVKLVSIRDADKEPVVLEGLLRTVSDVEALRLQLDDGSFVNVVASNLGNAVIGRLLVRSRVRIEASVTEKYQPGGDEKFVYKAVGIEVL